MDKIPARKIYPPGSEVSLVFFSHPSKYSIVVDDIKKFVYPALNHKPGNRMIEITYHFKPRDSASPGCLALIPIGRIPQGSILVNWKQNPVEGKNTPDVNYAGETICKGYFLFAGAVDATKARESSDQENWSKPESVPLSEVWGWNITGTKPIDPQRGDPKSAGEILAEIENSLPLPFAEAAVAKQGFAVAGTVADALREAKTVLVDHKLPRTSFSPDDEISIIFFRI